MVDLNADVGESFGRWRLGDDEALLDVVTSANVACGFHAGDPLTLRRTCALAAARGVAVGAQVGYRDLAGFGRRRMDVAPDDLSADVLYQLGALDAMTRVAGARVTYVKPHGALYWATHDDDAQAAAVVEAVVAYDAGLAVLASAGSVLLRRAREAGLATTSEVFADRGYAADGRLVGRDRPGALLHDADEVADRVLRMVRDGVVLTVDGDDLDVEPESVCLHGDTPGAVGLARAVRRALDDDGTPVAAFAPPLVRP